MRRKRLSNEDVCNLLNINPRLVTEHFPCKIFERVYNCWHNDCRKDHDIRIKLKERSSSDFCRLDDFECTNCSK